jgi:hypothetical protein
MNAMPPADRGLVGDIVVLACAVSAGIHAGLIPAHVGESWSLGAAFALAATLAAVVAVGLRRSSGVWPPAAAAVLLAGLIAAYAVSCAVGLPQLGVHAESPDVLGLGTKTIEAVGLIAAVLLCIRPERDAGGSLATRRQQEV